MQENFFAEVTPDITDKKKFCRYHKWVRDEDFIKVTAKSSGKEYDRCPVCERVKLENKKIHLADWEKEKKEVSDYYVRTVLKKEKRTKLKMDEFPYEMIQAKKAALMIRQAVKELQKPLKKCIRHGDLYEKDCIKSGKTKEGVQLWKCKECMKEYHAIHYDKNKEKINAKTKKYFADRPGLKTSLNKAQRLRIRLDPEKYEIYKTKTRERFKKWEEAKPEFALHRNKRYKRLARANLKHSYVRNILAKDTNLRAADFPISLVETKRVCLQLKRGIKANKNPFSKQDNDVEKITKELDEQKELITKLKEISK